MTIIANEIKEARGWVRRNKPCDAKAEIGNSSKISHRKTKSVAFMAPPAAIAGAGRARDRMPKKPVERARMKLWLGGRRG